MKEKLLILFTLLIANQTLASSCKWSGNFIKSSKKSETIIKAKIVGMLYHFENGKTIDSNNQSKLSDYLLDKNQGFYQSIKIEVIELIKGKEQRKHFEIYGSNGNDFRESINIFKLGKTYIFSIFKSRKTEYSQPNEDENDYAIMGCSENWLECLPRTNEVRGYIKGKNRRKKRTYSYSKLLTKIT